MERERLETMLRQRLGELGPIYDCTTLRGVVSYAAGSRFVDNGITVLTAKEIADAFDLIGRMEFDEELAGNISVAGSHGVMKSSDDLDEMEREMGERLSGILNEYAPGSRLEVVDLGTKVEDPKVAKEVAPTIRLVIAAQIAEMLDVPNDLYEQRMLMRSRLVGIRSGDLDGDLEEALEFRNAIVEAEDSGLPLSLINNGIDYRKANAGFHASYCMFLSKRHKFRRTMAMVFRDASSSGVEIEYEEVHN